MLKIIFRIASSFSFFYVRVIIKYYDLISSQFANRSVLENLAENSESGKIKVGKNKRKRKHFEFR